MTAASDRTGWIRIAAVAVWLLAAGVWAHAGLRGYAAPARVRARLMDLREVRQRGLKIEHMEQAKKAFLARPRNRPLDLAGLAARALENAATNACVETGRQPLGGGLSAVRYRVEAEQATLGALSPLIESAEGASPPWRLVGAEIVPDSPKPGKGRVRLDFETLADGKPLEQSLEK